MLGRGATENSNYIFWQKNKGLFKGKKAPIANAKKMIDALRINCSGPDHRVSNLSGGNQQKVALAKWLLSDAQILILDEPTRGVDVGARQEIYQIIRDLAAKGMAIVILSSELPEIKWIYSGVLLK